MRFFPTLSFGKSPSPIRLIWASAVRGIARAPWDVLYQGALTSSSGVITSLRPSPLGRAGAEQIDPVGAVLYAFGDRPAAL